MLVEMVMLMWTLIQQHTQNKCLQSMLYGSVALGVNIDVDVNVLTLMMMRVCMLMWMYM